MGKAYEGTEPYIFISYSHKDSELVMRCIDALQKEGYRVWYDAGIEAGSEWPEYIANHLANCSCVLAFISGNFAESNNCKQELNFAQNQKKDVLSVYIEEAKLPLGLQMQLGLHQALHKAHYTEEETFLASLCGSKLIQVCKVGDVVAEPEVREEPKIESQLETKPENQISEKKETVRKPRTKKTEKKKETPEEKRIREAIELKGKRIGRISYIIELLYVPLSFFVLWLMSENDMKIWMMLLIMIVPHTCIAIIHRILFASVKKKANKAGVKKFDITNAGAGVWILTIVSSILAALGGCFFLQTDIFFLWKVLLCIGMNIIPTCIALFISLYLME